ncbi:hypothetical protein CPHO_07190 [Corynebacterium phocae]|uniref:Uncharacterized protein n=1 Tax=Corynebacterium phocae TaxID=161895 RepID=A0A1L7D3M8_9CORY|nr:hypothetical protein [Corynebacterium phocae]APT92710.1 hypothetical protein CPHO_07190 [Corynebacterium phocae]KAA8723015.1 hypothetical protein F4V58_06695 [Corynebacterium phocae]
MLKLDSRAVALARAARGATRDLDSDTLLEFADVAGVELTPAQRDWVCRMYPRRVDVERRVGRDVVREVAARL